MIKYRIIYKDGSVVVYTDFEKAYSDFINEDNAKDFESFIEKTLDSN